jgi:hypothetical protein
MLRWMGAIDDNTLVVTSGKETLRRTLILAHLHPRCRNFILCSCEACEAGFRQLSTTATMSGPILFDLFLPL